MKKPSTEGFLWLLMMAVTVFFVLGYIVYPMWKLLEVSAGAENTKALLSNANLISATLNSLLLSVLTVLGAGLIGIYFAYTMHYKTLRWKSVFSTLLLLPIAIPPMVGVMAFLFLVGENGLLMRGLSLQAFHFNGWPAILIIHVYSFYPLFYLFTGTALKSIDSSVLEAAQGLGAGKTRTFFSVILPQLKPSLLAAALLVFMGSMASFSAPFIFGGSMRFLTTEIYYAKINGDSSFSALLAVFLAGISLLMLYFFRLYRSRIPQSGKSKGTLRQNQVLAYKGTHPFRFFSTLFFCVLILLPLISLCVMSLAPENTVMQQGLDVDFSFRNYVAVFSETDVLQPFLNSLQASGAAVLLTLVFALMIAQLTRGKRNTFTLWLETTASLPYGIPGTVIGIFLILGFNESTPFAFGQSLVGTFWILPVAYAIRNLPILVQAIQAGLHAVDVSIEEASQTLGASKFSTWRKVTLPLIFPSLLEGCLLVFINSFGEFVATVLLYGYSTRTMPIEIYSQIRMYNNGMAATYGVILFLIILGIIYLTRVMGGRQWKRG